MNSIPNCVAWMHFDVYNNVFWEVKVLFFYLFYVFQRCSTHLTLCLIPFKFFLLLTANELSFFSMNISLHDIELRPRIFVHFSVWNGRKLLELFRTLELFTTRKLSQIHKMLRCACVWKFSSWKSVSHCGNNNLSLAHKNASEKEVSFWVLRKLFRRKCFHFNWISFFFFDKFLFLLVNEWSKQFCVEQTRRLGMSEKNSKYSSLLACRVEHE